MRPAQIVVLWVGQVLLLLTLVGLWQRRRVRRLWLLPLHLVSTAVAQMLVWTVPQVFFDWTFWAWRELALVGLALGIVAEMAWRVFARLPAGQQRVRRWLGLALLVPLGLLLLVPWHMRHAEDTWLYVMVTELLPRLSYGAAWVCLALGFAVVWSRLPFDRLHWAVLAGLAVYLGIYATALGTLPLGPRDAFVDMLTPVAYTLMLAWWAWAAWRQELPAQGEKDHLRRFLHPWRD